MLRGCPSGFGQTGPKPCTKTQAAYLRGVSKLATFLKRAPHTATADDLRRFQLHLVDDGTSPITLNATISGLRRIEPLEALAARD